MSLETWDERQAELIQLGKTCSEDRAHLILSLYEERITPIQSAPQACRMTEARRSPSSRSSER